jgi:hypothetical protein
MSRARRAAILISLFVSPSAAFAQDKDADAERLFREGQQLMGEKRFGEACPKFEAAYRKDQQLGTLLNLAYCHKEQGAIWQAWLEFREAELKATELKRQDRREFAQKRMAELERSLARVVVDPPTKVELVEVLVEDRRIPEAEKGAIFAAEPGQRKLTFRAKGKKQATQLVSITKNERPQRVQVPEMEDQPKEPVVAEPAPPPPPPPASTPRPSQKPKEHEGWGAQKKIAVAAGGVGILGVAVGAVFGVKTMFGHVCVDGPATQCTRQVRDDASTWGAISTVSFIVGGVALGTAAVLWLTAPSSSGAASGSSRRIVPVVGAGWAGLDGVF